MDELIGRLEGITGLSPDVLSKAIGIILNFLRDEGPKASVDRLLETLPGAAALLAEHGEGGSPGLLGGLGGLLSGGGGIMAAFGALTNAGLSMDQIRTVLQEFAAFAREHVGEETVNDIVASIPALARIA